MSRTPHVWTDTNRYHLLLAIIDELNPRSIPWDSVIQTLQAKHGLILTRSAIQQQYSAIRRSQKAEASPRGLMRVGTPVGSQKRRQMKERVRGSRRPEAGRTVEDVGEGRRMSTIEEEEQVKTEQGRGIESEGTAGVKSEVVTLDFEDELYGA